MLQLQQVQPFHMASEVVKNWNYQHSIYIPHNGIGFGGKMREGHAKKIFKNIHTDIMRKNIVQQTATAPTTTTTTTTVVPVEIPTKAVIQKMSSRDLKDHIRPIRNINISNSVQINKERLTNYYYPKEKET